MWDYYSLGALVLESVMAKDYFFNIESESSLKKSAVTYLSKNQSEPSLKRLIEGTIFASDYKHMMRLKEINDCVKQMTFI